MKPNIKLVKTADLIPYALNSRVHSDAQVSQIAASIKEFGFTNPVLTDGENGVIAGHGRLLAAQKLKLDQVPVIELGHLSEAQKKAYIIADNKLASIADWDMDALKVEIESLQELDFNLDLLGFSKFEISSMFQEGGDDSLFEVDDVKIEIDKPKKTDDGYVEFAVVLSVDNKTRLLSAINKIKNEHGTQSNEEALMIMCDGFA